VTKQTLERPRASTSNSPTHIWQRLSRVDYIQALLVAGAVSYFVVVASLYLDRPGLYYDESNFVPASLGGQYVHIGWVTARFDGIPTMIMSYIGALKSYLYAPIFAILGVSVATIRGPVIALSALTLALSYVLARQFLGKWASVLLVALMATFPSFIFMTKVDWGPVVLAMLLKIACLVVFFRLLATGRIRYLWALGLLDLLGIYNKQDFTWFTAGLVVGSVLVYGARLWDIARRHRTHVIVALTTLAAAEVGLAYLVVVPTLSSGGQSSFQNPFPHLLYTWNNYLGVLGSQDLLTFWTGQASPQPSWIALTPMFVAGSLLFLGATRLRAGPFSPRAAVSVRAAIFFLIVFAVMLFEIAATTQATGLHHVIELWPFQHLVLLPSATAVVQAIHSTRNLRSDEVKNPRDVTHHMEVPWLGTASLSLAGLALVTSIAGQAVSTANLLSAIQQPSVFRPVFRTDLYSVAGFVNANYSRVDEVIAANWGVGTPLFALSCPSWRDKVRDDLWPSLVGLTPQAASTIMRSQFGNERVLVISLNSQSQGDLPPSIRDTPATLIQSYALLYPNRHPSDVFTTSTYNVTYFGPQEDFAGNTRPDEGCSTQGAEPAALQALTQQVRADTT
jgi:hypothetical protein